MKSTSEISCIKLSEMTHGGKKCSRSSQQPLSPSRFLVISRDLAINYCYFPCSLPQSMSSRYRVDYALKEHRRDEFIQWIKALLATPFVLSCVNAEVSATPEIEEVINNDAFKRYVQVFKDIERLVIDHMESKDGNSRLSKLVPSIGIFFTNLPLADAFSIIDKRRSISKRRLVAPSFNDIRIILNTAQIIELAAGFLKLITFDGDITLYDDGKNFDPKSPILKHIITLLSKDIIIGIVTAAGYTEAGKYYERLGGLIDGIANSEELTTKQKENLVIMGGEANFMFKYDNEVGGLTVEDESSWILPDMNKWNGSDITAVLDFAEIHLQHIVERLALPAFVLRKERAVGLVPKKPLIREQLEEAVLRIDNLLRNFQPASNLKWCAFNGGSDVWVDIGDKSLGVQVLQQFCGRKRGMSISAQNTLHVGDQFSSVGSNDYASRTAATTAWIDSPKETCSLLEDLVSFLV